MDKKDLNNKVKTLFDESFTSKEITDVPDVSDSRLTHGATGLEGDFTFLYVDLRGSSSFTGSHRLYTIAKIYKAFHHCMVECIKHKGGRVRSFDGDRVMAVFGGNRKVNDAVECAKYMVGCLYDVLQPKIKSYYNNTSFDLGIGIATGKTAVIKAGIGYDKNNRDLVWIGDPPNLGAKLSDKTLFGGRIGICSTSFSKLTDKNKFTTDEYGNKKNMWTYSTIDFGGKQVYKYNSTWYYPL